MKGKAVNDMRVVKVLSLVIIFLFYSFFAVAQEPKDARESIEATSRIQTLKEIVKKDPRNLSAWVELGNLYFDTNKPKEAIEAYSRYLAIKPDNADVRTDMGIMYRKLGQFDRTIEEFKKAAQSDPKHANSRYNTGLVLLHDKEDMKGAIKAWEEYLKVDPNSERAIRVKEQINELKDRVKWKPSVVKAGNKGKTVSLQTFVNAVAGRTYHDIVAKFGEPSCKGSAGIIYNNLVKEERTGEILSVYIDFQPGFPVGTVMRKEGRMVVGFSDMKYLAANIACRYYDFEVRDVGDPVVQNFRVYRSVNKQGWVPSCDAIRQDERAQQ